MDNNNHFKKAQQECIENASCLYEEAKLLYTNRHYARALALGVLGVEEVGKARMCQVLDAGHITAKDQLIQGRKLGKSLQTHKDKQAVVAADLWAILPFEPIIQMVDELADMDYSTKEKQDELANVLETRLQDYLGYLDNLITSGTPEYELSKIQQTLLANLHHYRLHACYVEFNSKTGEIICTPKQIGEEKAISALKILQRALKLFCVEVQLP